jgi:antitoxin MazE
MMAAKVKRKRVVQEREERGRIVSEPTFDLDTLSAGITDENRHDEADFGCPVGKER